MTTAPLPCDQCGNPRTGRSKYCTPQCRERHKYDRKKQDGRCAAEVKRKRETYTPRIQTPVKPARSCGYASCNRMHHSNGLCKMHDRQRRRATGQLHDYKPWDDRARDRYHRRRAQRHGARNSDQVLMRDLLTQHMRCPECHKEIDTTLKWPHPYSKSIDHIRPLSRGGEHTLANTQLMHLRCNIRKGARYSGL